MVIHRDSESNLEVVCPSLPSGHCLGQSGLTGTSPPWMRGQQVVTRREVHVEWVTRARAWLRVLITTAPALLRASFLKLGQGSISTLLPPCLALNLNASLTVETSACSQHGSVGSFAALNRLLHAWTRKPQGSGVTVISTTEP